MSKEYDIIDIPELTQDDVLTLTELFKHPILKKYIKIIGLHAIRDIAYTAIPANEEPEVFIRKQVHSKAILQTLDKFVIIANLPVKADDSPAQQAVATPVPPTTN